MINLQQEKIELVVASIESCYTQTYGRLNPQYGNILGWIARQALENISNTDALYHNIEHTVMVALAGQEILRGKHLREGGVTPHHWLQFMTACLCHDIGYVRGVCRNDRGGHFDNGFGEMLAAPAGCSDASLTPYHVDRGKLFVRERFSSNMIEDAMDMELVCDYIEKTRFGAADLSRDEDISAYPALVQAADFIGQLGDPSYLRKIPALYYEFQEIGVLEQLGYTSPGAMRTGYAQFFWRMVSPRIQGALHYLNVSHQGKQWVASLYAHVFTVEHHCDATSTKTPDGIFFE